MPCCRAGRVGQVIASLLILAVWCGSAFGQNPAKLRYNFQAGKQYAYEIKIEAELEDTIESREGISTYNVLSADDRQVVLKQSGTLASQSKPRPGRGVAFGPPRFRGFPPGFHGGPRFGPTGPDAMTIDRSGKLVLSKPLTHLPFLLGDLETLVIEEFPADGRSKWQSARDVVTVEKKASSFRFGPRSQDSAAERPAKEQIDYEVIETRPQDIRFKKTYSLRTSQEGAGPARFDMSGSGEFTFDAKEGLISALSMKYQISVNEPNLTLRVPVTVTCRLLTPAELAEHERKKQEARRAAELANAPKPLSESERTKLLDDLRAHDPGRLKSAADRLAKAVVDSDPAPVAQALAPLLSHSDDWVKGAAAKAMTVWATPEAEDALVQASASENLWVRGAAIEALGKLKSEKAAKAVASQMYRNRGEAGKALKAMGPVAEAATLDCLKDRDGWVRKEALSVLAAIGGKASLQPIKQYAQRATGFDRRDADNALDAIERRLANPPQSGKAGELGDSAKPKLRTWRDSSGVFEVQATLVSSEGGRVLLRKKDGRMLAVPLNRLSPTDQAYVAEQAKKQ